MIDMVGNFLLSFSLVFGGLVAVILAVVILLFIWGIMSARASKAVAANMGNSLGDMLKQYDTEDKKE